MARAKKPKKPKAPPKPKKPKAPRRWSEHGTLGKQSPADRVSPYSAGGTPALDLVVSLGAPGGLGTTATGLGGVILELVGEGSISPGSVGSALEAWQREQDRISNRAWRRPGGMARMGGL